MELTQKLAPRFDYKPTIFIWTGRFYPVEVKPCMWTLYYGTHDEVIAVYSDLKLAESAFNVRIPKTEDVVRMVRGHNAVHYRTKDGVEHSFRIVVTGWEPVL